MQYLPFFLGVFAKLRKVTVVKYLYIADVNINICHGGNIPVTSYKYGLGFCFRPGHVFKRRPQIYC